MVLLPNIDVVLYTEGLFMSYREIWVYILLRPLHVDNKHKSPPPPPPPFITIRPPDDEVGIVTSHQPQTNNNKVKSPSPRTIYEAAGYPTHPPTPHPPTPTSDSKRGRGR